MVATGNVGLAFGLVIAAGLSTTLGAAVVFCASLARPKLLAVSLGFAAGVMIYVSFGEIFLRKATGGFQDVGYTEDEAYRYATFCFFGGMVVIALLDQIVHLVASFAQKRSLANANHGVSTANLLEDVQSSGLHQDCCAQQTGEKAPSQQNMSGNGCAEEESGNDLEECSHRDKETASAEPIGVCEVDAEKDALQVAAVQEQAAQQGSTSRQAPAVVEIMQKNHHNFALKKMGILTGLAIFIHNFPEGLATFVGALADTRVGVGIAVAIAMHNIPEGICVAMPIYYATGSKWKGFLWAFLSGVSEPVGGLMGFLVLTGNQDLAFAIVFGLVAGMMIYISIKELIPTALKYDPDDKVVTTSVIAGMVVMAGSLLLFTI